MSLPSLVFVYGPPAAGKLTVARALAERIGWRVFHNHAAFDLAAEIFEPFTPGFGGLVETVRLSVFEAASKADVGLVFTFVFGDPDDRPFVEKVEAVLARSQRHACFVQLHPAVEELERRVVMSSRGEFRKLRDIDGLRASLARWDLATPVHDSDLRIDNTSLAPDAVAEMIQRHFGV